MKDEDKTKEQLINELMEMRPRIAELEASETERMDSEELFKVFFSSAPIGIYILQDRKFQFVNPQFQEDTGYSEDELLGVDSFRLVLPKDRDMLKENAVQMLKGNRSSSYEYRTVRKQGELRWILETVTPIQYHGRRATVGYYMDITERKRAEEALQKRTHDLNERVKELCCLYGISHLIEKQDISLEEIFQGVVALISPAWQYPEITCARITIGDKEFKTDNFKITEWKQTANIRIEGHKEGTVEVYYLQQMPYIDESPFLTEERALIEAIAERLARTIERKRAEEMLRESEEKYKELAESITDVFFAFTEDLRYTYWNRASEELVGISAKDALGKHLYDIFPDTEMTRSAEEMYLKAIRTKQPQHFINEYQLGGRDFFFEISAYPTANGVSVFVKDITERKQMEERLKEYSESLERMVEERTQELRDAHEKLVRTEKLAAIGELAGGVGHELRNPLATIKASAYFLKMKMGNVADEKVGKHLDMLDKQVGVCDQIISDLLDFSRPGKPEVKEVDINQVVQKVVQATAPPQNVEISTSLAGDMTPVMADAGQLERAFSNLVTNAIQAMPQGGKLSFSTSQEESFIEVRVADTGGGIPEENLDKVFEPLFTTKAKGVGLGLALAKALVERQGGVIEVESQVGEGTTFTVKLPIARPFNCHPERSERSLDSSLRSE